MMRCFLIVCLLLCAIPAFAQPIPRTVIAIYDGKEFALPQQSTLHRFAEMPLNHLGLTLEYHDIRKGLPNLAERTDVRGVLTWFRSDDPTVDPLGYIHWVETEVLARGKKFVVLGVSGFVYDKRKRPEMVEPANRLMRQIGLEYVPCGWPAHIANRIFKFLLLTKKDCVWVEDTRHSAFVKKDTRMVGFEHKLEPKPSYSPYRAVDERLTAYLTARQADDPRTDSVLVSTHPNGGFVEGYYPAHTRWNRETGKEEALWTINPFLYFADAFDTDDLPKPDTTTLAGRRIYYSHIDGDGWNNHSEAKGYHNEISAKVYLEEIAKKSPDLPVTIAPIGADLDPAWIGTEKSRTIAKEMLALPQVAVATHTYSHPFDWGFFADYTPEKERPFLDHYFHGHWDGGKSATQLGRSWEDYQGKPVPRAFANEPFDLDKEITGSVAYIRTFTDKPVTMLMWSGNTTPWEEALRKTREAGLLNINGGDGRFDKEFPSYCWVAPIGRPVGRERQIYSSNANENLYAHTSDPPYDGFKLLTETLERTESPIRIKPFNLYYHIFSADFEGSLQAIRDHIAYARKQRLTPIEASRFTAIANGFYTAEIAATGPNSWEVRSRGSLQTIRFDHGKDKHVDFTASHGIAGQVHYQDALYVYLDEAVTVPKIALSAAPAPATHPYLIDSRWRVWNLNPSGSNLAFLAQGYGKGEMRWKVPADGTYTLTTLDEKSKPEIVATAQAKDEVVVLSLDREAIKPVALLLEQK